MNVLLRTVLCAMAMLLSCAASASAQLGRYDACDTIGDATVISVSATTCQDVRAVVTSVVGAPPAQSATVLRTAGWTPLRAEAGEDGQSFDVVARRGRSVLRIRRPGEAPDLDGWMAGRELIFSSGT